MNITDHASLAVESARDALTVRRAFGEPYQVDGATVIPVARVVGGGFGVRVRPVGAYVVSGGTVTWRPALDLNRVILGGQLVGVVVALAGFSALRRSRRR